MAKETFYFSHDSNAITDTKILNMRADYNLEGYGLYWAIIEMLRNEENYKLELSKNTYRAIKTLTNTNIDIEKFINDCIDEYKLFVKENEYFYSNSLLKRMKKYEEKKEINKQNGKLGGRPKNQNKTETKPNGFKIETETKPNENQTESEINQNKIKENKIKENKIKENKIKENKINNIKNIYNMYCVKLPQIQKLTEKRKKAIDKFLKEFTEEQFEEICKIANTSEFLIGENDRGWKADFDFIIRTDKALNILEGKYNKTTKQDGWDYINQEINKMIKNGGEYG